MTARIATYRLQFREGMTFDASIDLVPYLSRLGVSHLYASPLFTATTGSTHGYDVTDCNEIDPALGGREGFERLSEALRRHGLALMLDIVPNHMAASPENGWWRDAAEWGEAAAHACHFDIDWSEPLTLPVLGATFEETLATGDLSLRRDEQSCGLTLAFHEHAYPLTPPSYSLLAGAADHPALNALAEAAARARPEAAPAFHAEAAAILAEAPDLPGTLARLSEDRALLTRLHEAQPWRLLHWQEGRRNLSYRRFFEITGLAGTRVEDPQVFDDIHRLALALLREGHVDALRIDHVDGLRDPAAYLRRLRAEAPDAWIVVEKILEGAEPLPDWPVEGATGYEFIETLRHLHVAPEGAARLDAAFRALDHAPPVETRRDHAKRRILTRNFEGELTRLTASLAPRLPGEDPAELREALTALITALPVYRTYGDAAGFPDTDAPVLAEAAARAAEMADAPLVRRLVAALSAPEAGDPRARFQQLSGAVMAKAVEDTLFYRHTPHLSQNEVGCDPAEPPEGAAEAHRRLISRAPFALNATATHDTKRGEDARARLHALAEDPETWIAAVARWRVLNAPLRGPEGPDAATEWTLLQGLAGVWPDAPGLPDAQTLEALRARFAPYIVKALREAKLRTSWTAPDEAHEAAVTAWAEALLSPDNRPFLEEFAATLRPYLEAGRTLSLAQLLLKLTAPGVPDLYQGAEGGDFSLVDPDNRRPPDWPVLSENLAKAAPDPADLARAKPFLIAAALAERRRAPDLFARGAYLPLQAAGPRAGDLFAFLRTDGPARALVAVPTRALRAREASPAARWAGTTLLVPPGARPLQDRLAPGRAFDAPEIAASELFETFPVALLGAPRD
ncbi:MAG: malto-oligosyltrehalose synthase [Pseudomonadota bacterium]